MTKIKQIDARAQPKQHSDRTHQVAFLGVGAPVPGHASSLVAATSTTLSQ
jgi:hypothetical protein